ncbi:putative Ig domain-containing protein, partial [Kosakonia radicincitans]|uniref:putative Ig domain-containing protein n=1 Tax=Kosakonia radicincitans TaxID=283686 RepID=UPI002368C364
GSVVSAADISKLTFRPTANANGTGYASFTWQVSDGTALSANTGTMTLNVTPVNDAPTLSSGATVTLTSTTEDVTSSATTVSSLLNSAGYGDVDSGASSGIAITATVGNGGWQYSTDSGANWFNIGTVSSSAALLLGSTAQLRYVPDSANGETATLSFSAWDQTSGTATAGSSKGLADTSTSGGSSAFSANSAQASLMVTSVNDAPTMGSTVSPQSATKDTVFSFAVPAGTFVDVDSGDTLTLSATLSDGSALPAWLSFNPSTRTFSGTPGYSDVGNLTIRITATDGSNASVSTTFGLTVNNSNLPPVVSIPMDEQSIAQNGSFNFTVPAGTFTDPDIGDTLTLSATLADGSALPAWLSFEPATRTFSGTPGNGDVGNLTIRVTATDGSNASVSTTFGLVVTNVNDAPVIGATIAPQSIAQDGSLSFTVPAGTFVDPDGDPLTLSATLANGNPLPAWLHFDPATGSFSGTPGNADVGNLNIRITASDGSASVSTSFSLMVTNVNDAPVLSTPIPPQSVAQDGSFNLTVPAGTFVDPDGDTLTLSATQADGSALPAWLRFDPAKGSFSGTPGNADIGSLVIRVTATDAGNTSISTTFSLTVTRAGITSGDPQFRISDGTNGPRPVDSQTPTIQPQEAAAPPLNTLITPTSLGSFNAGRTAGSGSMMASIFGASSDGASGRDATKSEVANVFGPGSSFGSHFESSLGSFPSFNKDPALGGSSSLASVFSGIYLPSLTPMEVFTGGSWKDINLHAQGVTEQGQEQATAAFIPSFHRQLQHIGDAEGQRLSAIEQALYDLGQQQG